MCFSARPPHEAISEDIANKPDMLDELRDAIENGALPPAYFTNSIVQQYSTIDVPVIPLGLFLDGVPYSHVDSVCGVWIISLIDSSRYYVASIRKQSCMPLRVPRMVHILFDV